MKVKFFYLALCVVGIVLPYWQFIPWIRANGLNLRVFFELLFANRIGGFFGMDVLVSALTLLVFTRVEVSRLNMRGGRLVYIAVLTAVLTVGVSLGLPLLLYLRDVNLAQADG